MNREALAAAISESKDGLVRDLSGIDDAAWGLSSLCKGWTVRDVVAHLIRLRDYFQSPARYGLGMVRYGFRPNRFQKVDALRRAQGQGTAALLADLREVDYLATWVWRHHPSPEMTLADLVIHAQDIRRPLGMSRDMPITHLRATADLIVRDVPRFFRYPLGGWRLPTVRFEATDVEWAWGSGPVITGSLEAIVMVLAGRAEARRELSGDVGLLAG